MKKEMDILETTQDTCCGWQKSSNPDECPHDGEYNSKNSACIECAKYALQAMEESINYDKGEKYDKFNSTYGR